MKITRDTHRSKKHDTRVIFYMQFERRQRDNEQTYMKTEGSILEYFEYFWQMSSKLILTILSYTVPQLVRFFRYSVVCSYKEGHVCRF